MREKMKKRIGMLVLMLVLIVSACSKPDEKIVGKWEDNIIGFVTYEFTKDGKVTIDGDEVIKGEYKTKGDKLIIEVGEEKQEAEYEIKGDTLVIKPKNEEALEFDRIKKGKESVAANTTEDDSKEKEADKSEAEDESEVPTWVANEVELHNLTDIDDIYVRGVYADKEYIYVLYNDAEAKYYFTIYDKNQNQIKKDMLIDLKTMPEQKRQEVSFYNGQIYNKSVYNSHKSDKAREEANYLGDDFGVYMELVPFNNDGLIQSEAKVAYDNDIFLEGLRDVSIINTSQGLGVVKTPRNGEENRKITLIDDPTKSFEIVDKESIIPRDRTTTIFDIEPGFQANLIFYDAERSLLYFAEEEGIFVLDNKTGEPVYENGVDKNLGFPNYIGSIKNDKEFTLLMRDEDSEEMPSIVKVDEKFQTISEAFTPVSTQEISGSYNISLLSPGSAIIWENSTFERKPSINAMILELKKE